MIDQFDKGMKIAVSREKQGAVAAAEALSDRLGGLPLALHAAGRYLTIAVRMDPEAPELPSDLMTRYAAQLDDEFSVVDRAAQTSTRGSGPAERELVTATWRISLGLLKPTERSEATRVLSVMACLAATPLPVDVVVNGLWAEPDGRSDAHLLLASLEELALLEISEDDFDEMSGVRRVVAMHRSVHDSIQADFVRRLDPAGVGAYFTAAVELLRIATGDLDPREPETHPRWSLLIPHVLAVFANLSRLAEAEVADLFDIAMRACAYLVATGEGGEAERIAERVLEASRDILGVTADRTLRAQWALATIYMDAAEDGRAESILRDLISASADDDADVDEELVLRAQHELGQIYTKTGRLSEAEQIQREVLEKCTARLGEANPTTLIFRGALASTLAIQRDFTTAADELRTVASALGFAVGREHDATLTCRRNLAKCLLQIGRPAEAIAELEELLRVLDRRSGAESEVVLALQVDIALAYQGMGDLTGAETRLRRVIASFERANERLGPESTIALNGLAIVLFEKGQAEEAKRILLRVVVAVADEYGNAHPNTKVALQNLVAVAEHAPLTEDEMNFIGRTGLLDSGEDQLVTVMKRIVQELEGGTDAAPGELIDARIALYILCVATGADHDQIATLREQVVADDLITDRFARSGVRRLVLDSTVTAPNELALRRYVDYLATLSASERPDDELELAVRHEFAGLLEEAGQQARATEEYAVVLQRTAEKLGLNHQNTIIIYLNYGGIFHNSAAWRPKVDEFICDAARAITEFSDSWFSDPVQRFLQLLESVPVEEQSMAKKFVGNMIGGIYGSEPQSAAVVMLSGILCMRAFAAEDDTYGDAFLAWRNFGQTLLNYNFLDPAEQFLRNLLVVAIAREGVHSHAANATELLLLEVLFRMDRFDEVITECTQLLPHLTEEPDVRAARSLLAAALLATGDIDRASKVAREVPMEACSADTISIELDLADAFLQRERARDAMAHLGRILMVEARLHGAYSENSLQVIARIEASIGDEAPEYADAGWFADYQRIHDALHRAVLNS